MRKLTSLLLAAVLLLSCTVTAFAVEDDPVEIGVYAKTEYSIDGEYTAPVENGSASVTTPDGAVSVTNAPTDAVILVVIPMEGEALTWIAGCVEDNTAAAYDIHFRDADGNRINASGAKINITVSGNEVVVSSVTTSGTDTPLTAETGNGKVSFTTDGSHYYVLTENHETQTKVTIEKTSGGKVEISDDTHVTGQTVTITAKPNNGKVVDKVTVTDENGKAVKIKDNGDGTYSFEQPDGDVTVKVTFKNKPSSGDTPQTGDNSNIWLWLTLLIISAMMLIYMGSKMRKRSAE